MFCRRPGSESTDDCSDARPGTATTVIIPERSISPGSVSTYKARICMCDYAIKAFPER
jgi:hypothetical protein